MNEPILNYIRAPKSGNKLEIEVFEFGKFYDGESQIISGKLYCDDEEYPIINGVPRLLNDNLLELVWYRYQAFFSKYKEKFRIPNKKNNKNFDGVINATSESFGTQWNLFSEMYGIWRDNFLEYISPNLNNKSFENKIVLDCGCGFGRHLYYAAEFGAKIALGFDLSHSVDVAARNVSKYKNAHVIQADIYNIPVIPNFDIAYCIGVLQHTPEPIRAFQSIFEKINNRGTIYAWIYGKRPKIYHAVVDSLRKVTVGHSPKILYFLTFFLAIFSFGFFALPRRILSIIGLAAIGEKIPFSGYAQYPFRVSQADWYDRLSAPITDYFDELFPQKLLESVNCSKQDITFRKGGSWKVFGIK
ncbi:MAG: class I SAM-dependent methyltransferase [Actinobacteria bacterium]|nr:class I SAM-dependent methyltransferase [Actinomycetota bacterium]